MHELVINTESNQSVPSFVHVASFSQVCDVVLYLQTLAEPKPGRLADDDVFILQRQKSAQSYILGPQGYFPPY
jgi:hypothetical protein